MKVNVWMPFYWGDYLGDTRRLSTVQHGAYLLLIGEYWQTAEPLPDDDATLARLTLLSLEEWQTHRSVISRFFIVDGGVWRHKRIDAELAKATSNREAKSRAGKSGAAKRWDDKSNATTNGSAIPLPLTNGCQNGSPSSSSSPSEVQSLESDVPVEPLSSFPKTEAEAIGAVANVGCPEDFVVLTWKKAMGRGGRDAKDIPIRNWSYHLATEWSYERPRRTASGSTGNTAAALKPEPIWAQEKAIQAAIDDLDRQIKALPDYARCVFPDEFEAAQKKKKPLKEQKSKLIERLSELKRDQAGSAV